MAASISSMEECSPDTLSDICISYCVHHLETFCDYDTNTEVYSLRQNLSLPAEICERLLKACYEKGFVLDDKFLHIFKDSQRTHLRRINLRDSYVTDVGLQWLIQHRPLELDISGCTALTSDIVSQINKYGRNLGALFIGNSVKLFQNLDIKDEDDEERDSVASPKFGEDYIFDCPRLRAFSVHNLSETDFQAQDIISTILNPLERLSYLDLSGCEIDIEFMKCLEHLKQLVTLVLYDVPMASNVTGTFRVISKLTKLKVLDLSQSKEGPVLYQEPERNLAFLVHKLPDLQRLDISGTNLAGFQKPENLSHRPNKLAADELLREECSIPGLEGRHLDFLGLLGCSFDACSRDNLPAAQVTGDANEDQVILSVQTYADKPDLLVKCLNHLFHIFRYSHCQQQRRALHTILVAMKRHPYDKHVQISGSASLFYIVKSDEKHFFSFKTKRKIISAILDGMENHMDEATMMRNGCLTLCHLKIPQDVLFEYERMVGILLKMVAPADQDDFVQRIGIYLLNSLACQVDGKEKQLVGDLGAITTMIEIIQHKMHSGICDEVMEIAWSTMWNVTDETAINCERFIEGDGMDLFLQCLEIFPDKPELLRNMMGLMGNVAEVDYLRCRLMKTDYVNVFSDLLDSNSDGIEVSYNACGVLAHMISDGPIAWGINIPRRQDVCQRMISAISRWSLKTKRNINYRSFEPILRLVPKFDTPESQHWAIWALCNLCTMYPQKYCSLVDKEGGLVLLKQVLEDHRPYMAIRQLAESVYTLGIKYKTDPDSVMLDIDMHSDHEGDDNQNDEEAD